MSESLAALFRTISSGVYVVSAAHGRRRDAFTAAWVAQISFRPLLLLVSVNPNNATYQLIDAGRAFAVNVLAQDQMDLARHFGTRSGRAMDKLARHAWRHGATGSPVLDDALSYFDCRVEFTRRAGDHVLVIGRVAGGAVQKVAAAPMIYSQTGDLDGAGALYPSTFDGF